MSLLDSVLFRNLSATAANAADKGTDTKKSSDDSQASVFESESKDGEIGDSFQSSVKKDEKTDEADKTNETDKTKEDEKKQEQKEIQEQIEEILESMKNIQSKINTLSDGDEKKALQSQYDELNSQYQELMSQLGSAGSSQGQGTQQTQGGTQSQGGVQGANSFTPTSEAEQQMLQYGQQVLNNLANKVASNAAAAAQSAGSSMASGGGSGRVASGGGYSGASAARSSNNFGSSGSSGSGRISTGASGADSLGGGSSNAINSSQPSGKVNGALVKAKDSNQSWGDYWNNLGYNSEKGTKVANKASSLHTNRKGNNKCATGVRQTFDALGYHAGRGHGYQWDDKMRKMDGYKEISTANLSKAELADMLKHLPAGAVVCWEQQDQNGNGRLDTAGEKYGHVTIADGNGGEISDHRSSSIYTSRINKNGFSNNKCSIFIPV